MANLDTAQLQTLKTDITLTHKDELYEGQTLEQWWMAGGDQEISEWYMLTAVPEALVWRADLRRGEVNEAVLYSELLTLLEIELAVYNMLLTSNGGVVDATSQNIRNGFSDILSGAQRATSRNNLIAAAKRPASYGEALYLTAIDGANTSAIYGDFITRQNVADARLV